MRVPIQCKQGSCESHATGKDSPWHEFDLCNETLHEVEFFTIKTEASLNLIRLSISFLILKEFLGHWILL